MREKINKKTLSIFFSVLFVLYFLYKVKSIMMPFLLGLLIAYLCKDTVEKYEKKISRHWLSMILISIVSLIFVIILIFIVPATIKQISEIIKQVLNFIQTFEVKNFYQNYSTPLKYLNIKNTADLQVVIDSISNLLVKYIADFTNIFLSSSWKFLNISFMIFISPIIAFYFLRDWKMMAKNILRTVPHKYKQHYNTLQMRIDNILHHYIIGQINVTIIMSIFYTCLLLFVKFKYSFVVGCTAGVLTLMPYIGAFGGCIIALMLGFFQFGNNLSKILSIIAIFSAGQFLEGNFITPALIGNKIKVHPLWLMFAMFAGGTLKGFIGIVLSMPIAAIIGVLLRFFQELKVKEKKRFLKFGKRED